MISIEPVTEWMENERIRIEHEAAKQRHKERAEQQVLAAQQAAAQAQQQPPPSQFLPPRSNVNRGILAARSQGDKAVVSKYKVIRRNDNNDRK